MRDDVTFWQMLTSNHYVGWTTPFLEGAMRGMFWGNVIGLPIFAVWVLSR